MDRLVPIIRTLSALAAAGKPHTAGPASLATRRRNLLLILLLATPAGFHLLKVLIRMWGFRKWSNRFVFMRTPKNKAIVDACPSLQTYRPTPWMTNGHLQTVLGALIRRNPSPDVFYSRELLRISDGAMVALDWALPRGTTGPVTASGAPEPVSSSSLKRFPGMPTVILLHGLTGGSQETYIKWMAVQCQRRGYSVVVMNARGCGDTELATAKSFSAAFTTDIRETVQHVRALLAPTTHLFLAGFSLGAGIMAKYVAEEGAKLQGVVTAAAACCASYDMLKTTGIMEQLFHRHVYNRKLAFNLARFLRRHVHVPGLKDIVDHEVALNCTRVRDFDEAVIVPMFKYETVWDYYKDASSGRRLQKVAIPLLMLNAEDDPICAASGMPLEKVLRNPNLIACLTKEGGHVAWCESMWPSGASWSDRGVCEFFEAAASTQHLESRSSSRGPG